MQIKCSSCGKALKVPDALKGKQVKCPSCQRAILVPKSSAELESLQIEEAPERPMPGTAGRRPAPAGSGRSASRRQGRKELAEYRRKRAHGRSGPAAAGPGTAAAGTCPSCGASMSPGTVVCTACGFDLMAGAGMSEKSASVLPKMKSFLGPVIAIVLVVVGGRFLLSRLNKNPEATSDQPVATAGQQVTPPEPQPAPEQDYSASGFSGGDVAEDVSLADTRQPYVIDKDIAIADGATLTLEPGVSIEGTGAITGGGGLVAAGEPSSPVVIQVRIGLASEAQTGPRHKAVCTRFQQPVEIKGPQSAAFSRCEFAGGLSISLADKQDVVKATVSSSILKNTGAGAVLKLDVPSSTSRMEAAVTGSDILGEVEGAIGPFSAVDLSDNYWSAGIDSGTGNLSGKGKKNISGASPDPVAKTGIATSQGGATAGFSIEEKGMILKVPAGWMRGGLNGARKPVPGGSATLITQYFAGRAMSLDTIFSREKTKYLRADKNLSSAQLSGDDSIAPRPGTTQYVFDLAWNDTQWKVFLYLVELKEGQAGIVFSAPAGTWEDTLSEIRTILETAELSLREEG
ncbi:MAG: hypothetical protein JW909_05090 [Planctomycetes bacterium]|nr:hypothetical protein [Planctomycetota bacterium]